jgi:hypothetical protein
MEMHILSDAQHKELSASLAAIQSILANSTNVVLEGKAPVAKTASVAKPVKAASRKARGRGVSVLNDTKVLEIKRQLAAGNKTVAKIAKDFGVHMTTINCIKWGKTWKHVQLQQEIKA